jgi:hypothetical protein
MAVARGRVITRQGSKQFFFKKKYQKTFDYVEPGGAKGLRGGRRPFLSS